MKKIKGERQIVIGVRTEAELTKEVIQAWKALEQRKPIGGPTFRLYFDSLDTLWRTLTPRRTELLQVLRQKGPLSIRKLATYLKRDYKNVRIDIRELNSSDLVTQTKEGLFIVPWDSIDLQIPLSAAS